MRIAFDAEENGGDHPTPPHEEWYTNMHRCAYSTTSDGQTQRSRINSLAAGYRYQISFLTIGFASDLRATSLNPAFL